MKAAACLFVLAAANAWGVSVGETYQQVISEKGKPRSSIVAGTMQMLGYPDASIKIRDNIVVSVTAVVASKPAAAPAPTPSNGLPSGAPPTQVAQIYALANQVNEAVKGILYIVNQPVTHVPRTPGMKVVSFGPAWFQAGATRPDFSSVDIVRTQTLPYDKYQYVSTDLNPGDAFIGNELEFNPMTKFFYVDRTVPKMKLSLDQMREVNRLYRIIGQCEPQLLRLGYSGTMP
jgi:hypothetical protein